MEVIKEQKLKKKEIENMAVEIREFLIEHEMWQDTHIFFNDKMFGQHDPTDDKYYYNDRDHLVVEEDVDPNDYLDYVNPDHILSMSFEGPACHMIYYRTEPEIKQKFDAIFEKYGVYYEFGDHWNFTCYM